MAAKEIHSIAILGAGAGGCACAADLTLRGYDVRLHARSERRLRPLRERGGIEISGGIHQGFAELRTLTSSVAEAIENADLIMIAVSAPGLSYYAHELSSLITPARMIFLNPGQTGGGLHFLHELHLAGYEGDVQLCETASLTQVCRLQDQTHVHMPAYIHGLAWGAFPGKHGDDLFAALSSVYPHIVRAKDVMETSLANMNMLIHPPGMLMNAGWIQHTSGDFCFYHEGFTDAVGRVADAMDKERLRIGEALDAKTLTMLQMLRNMGVISEVDARKGDVSRGLLNSQVAQNFRAPDSLNDRFILEDVAYGLVPMSEFGHLCDVPTPTIDAIIHLASVAVGVRFGEKGLTIERMGLIGVNPSNLHQFLWEGGDPQ